MYAIRSYYVNQVIRKIGNTIDIVIEGRDITTVVFPDAKAKFYFDAKPEVRARRRFDQGVSDLSLNEIIKSIEERDQIDKNRITSYNVCYTKLLRD